MPHLFQDLLSCQLVFLERRTGDTHSRLKVWRAGNISHPPTLRPYLVLLPTRLGLLKARKRSRPREVIFTRIQVPGDLQKNLLCALQEIPRTPPCHWMRVNQELRHPVRAKEWASAASDISFGTGSNSHLKRVRCPQLRPLPTVGIRPSIWQGRKPRCLHIENPKRAQRQQLSRPFLPRAI